MPMFMAIVVGVMAWGICSGGVAAQTRGQHAVCGSIQGYTGEDLSNIKRFCDLAMTEEMTDVTVSVNARESLLFVTSRGIWPTRCEQTGKRPRSSLACGWIRGERSPAGGPSQ